MDHSHDADLMVQQPCKIIRWENTKWYVGHPSVVRHTKLKDMHLWLKTEPKKEEPSYGGTVFCASMIGKKARHMSAGYIMWECECTHVFGNATFSNIIRKNSSSTKCVYRVYSVRYVESMFLYCPNHTNKQKVRKNTFHAL